MIGLIGEKIGRSRLLPTGKFEYEAVVGKGL